MVLHQGMRSAVCLSGNMRTFQRCAESLIRNIAAPNNADIFIATWDVIGNAKHSHEKMESFQQQLDVEAVKAAYGERLKDIAVFPFNETQRTMENLFYRGMTSMWWQVRQADLLRQRYQQQHGFVYDFVVRARPDQMFHTGFQIDDLKMVQETLIVPNYDQRLMNDTFAVGDSKSMDYYSSISDLLPMYHRNKDLLPTEGGVHGWPEQLLLIHMQRGPYRLTTLPVQYTIERGEGYVE